MFSLILAKKDAWAISSLSGQCTVDLNLERIGSWKCAFSFEKFSFEKFSFKKFSFETFSLEKRGLESVGMDLNVDNMDTYGQSHIPPSYFHHVSSVSWLKYNLEIVMLHAAESRACVLLLVLDPVKFFHFNFLSSLQPDFHLAYTHPPLAIHSVTFDLIWFVLILFVLLWVMLGVCINRWNGSFEPTTGAKFANF